MFDAGIEMRVRTQKLAQAATLAAATAVLAGCGTASGGGGDPGARSLPMGQSCQSIRSELNRMDGRGVPALVERASNGGKLSGPQKADADAYNRLLGQYLGARCHV
jgi:predicted small secreted protein